MKQLSAQAQQQIAAFLTSSQVRPLENALYAYHFSGGSADDVLSALTAFQNPDGGFGHGLEPDLRLPASSVIASSVAFQRLRELHAPADHPLVVSGCRYLRDQYVPARANWDIIPPTIDDAPHAPWWVYGGDLSHSLLNPRAEVLGYLYEYPDHFPADMRQQAADAIVSAIETDTERIDMHDLFCAIRLYETPALPEALKTRLLPPLQHVAERLVTRDPAGWAEYGLAPLGVASSPESPFADQFRAELDTNLDYLIDQLEPSGSWGPNWTWGGLHPEAWAQAERDWRGVITLNNLCTLKAFGRLA